MAASFSLEVFPPKNAQSSISLWKAVNIYEQLEPSYISVTCHGSGTQSGLTSELVEAMSARPRGTPIAPHIVCYGHSKAEIIQQLDTYRGFGIQHVVALRGDKREGVAAGEFAYASDLVKCIRSAGYPFQVHVAGYPEKHPESNDLASDLAQLKAKVDAGADSIITQFFFDPDVFLRYRDKLYEMGVRVPIVPGILPILDFKRLVSFAAKCQASVPDFLHRMFADYSSSDRTSQQLLAMNVLTHQITKLHASGIDHFHFYTLNELTLTSQTCKWMNTAL